MRTTLSERSTNPTCKMRSGYTMVESHRNECHTLLRASATNMGKTASRRPLLLRFTWARAVIAATLGPCLTCVFLLPAQAHALDPNKRITQYMHTSWRIQDGSLPAGMYHIAQTPDGFIWLLSLPGNVYRFDGIKV